MFRLLTITAAAVLFLLPLHTRAGGPPLLCLPIDGATADNADACATRVQLALDLGEEIQRPSMRQNDGQWYLTFHFNRDRVRLAEIDAALKGSPFSVPRDKLRLFGDVILEVDVRDGSADKLLADLKTQKHVLVSESKREDGTLLVTLTLPAPQHDVRSPATFGSVSFQSETFQSEGQSDAAKASELPTFAVLRGAIEKHNASLKGLRWNCWGCRALGCIGGAKADRVSTTAVLNR
jgi:hypothetical protein